MNNELIVILPAAGEGKRLGLSINKAFVEVGNVPAIIYNLKNLNSIDAVSHVIIVMRDYEFEKTKQLLNKYQEKWFPNLTWELALGGKERQNSVANALEKINSSYNGYIAVHDGARIFCDESIFNRVLNSAKKYGAAVAGVKVKDTIKVVSEKNGIINTPNRDTLRIIQTPQIFQAKTLKKAYLDLIASGDIVTDDAAAVERIGQKVTVAEGAYYNIKITSPEDLVWAENYLLKQEGEK